MAQMIRTGGPLIKPHAFNEERDPRSSTFLSSSNFSGPLIDPYTRQSINQKEHIEGLQTFFGVPTKEIRQSPYSNYGVENLDLPDAFVGPNKFLTHIIITQITQTDLFPLRYMFPWLRHEDSMNFTWDRIIFDDAMLGRTPEEGVSRLLTQRTQKKSGSVVRHGIALRLEHGFYMTKAGQMNWAMHMKQIANAIIETACYGCLVSALRHFEYSDPNERWRDNSSRSLTDLESLFRDEFSQWAALQKVDGGIKMLVSRAETIMKNRGVHDANVWLWPAGTKKFAQGSAQETLFLLSGRKSGEERDVVKSAIGGAVYDESRGFRQSSNEANHDPSFREQTIGTFFTADDAGVRSVPPEDFRTVMLDRLIYNENKDAFEVFGFMDHFKYAGLFEGWDDDHGGLQLSELGHVFFDPYSNWLDFLRKSDDHDYSIDTLLAKSRDVQIDFIRNVAGAVVADFSEKPQAGAAESGQKGQVGGRMNRSHRDQHETLGHVHKAIDSTQWSARAKHNAKQFSTWLSQLPEQGVPLMSTFHRYVQKNTDAQMQTSHNANWAHLGKWLLDYDKLNALAKLHTSNEFELTAFELSYNQARQQLAQLKGDSESLRHLKESVASADRRSPAWRPVQGKRPHIELRVTPYHSSQQYLPIFYQSLSLTLSSNNLVLFRVEKEAVDGLRSRNGSILLDTDSVSKSDPVLQDVERLALLQYSVSLSAVFSAVESYFDSARGDTAVQDSPRRALNGLVRSLLTVSDPVSGQLSVMQSASRKVQNDNYQPLTAQKFAERQIFAVSRLLQQFYESGQIDESSLDSGIQDVIDSLVSLDEDLDASSATHTQRAAGARAFASPTAELQHQAISRVVPDEKDREELRKLATQKVEQLQSVLVPTEKQRDSYTNSFRVYQQTYVFLYELLEKYGRGVVDGDINVVFENTVRTVHKLYGDRKANYNAADFTREYLNIVLNTLRTRTKPPFGLLSATDGSVSPDLKQTIVKLLADRGRVLATELESVIAKLKRPNEALGTYEVSWEEGKHKPDHVPNDFNSLFQVAFVNFGVAEGTEFALALTITWLHPDANTDDEMKPVIEKYTESRDESARKRIRGIMKAIKGLPIGADIYQREGFNKANKFINGDAADVKPAQLAAATAAAQEKLTKSQLEQVLSKMPISGRFVKWCLQRNVYVPIQLICFRPHQRYRMGTAILLAGGGKTGNTLHGFADFMVADNAPQKMHYGHYTQYMKTVIWEEKNMMLLHNVLCSGYEGGNGTSPWNPLDNEHIDSYLQNELVNDMFVVPERGNWKPSGSVLDITGHFHSDLGVNATTNSSIRYTLSQYLCSLWGWQNHKSPQKVEYDSTLHVGKWNTLCFQAQNSYYNHSTKSLSSVISEKGHWAGCVYEGAGKVRRGWVTQFNHPLMEIGYPRIAVS